MSGFGTLPPLARRGDPDTSHIAGEKLQDSGRWETQKHWVAAAMSEHKLISDDSSLTAHEFSRLSGIPHPTCHKRLPDLRKDGIVRMVWKRECRVTGEEAYTWRLNSESERDEYRAAHPKPPRKPRAPKKAAAAAAELVEVIELVEVGAEPRAG